MSELTEVKKSVSTLLAQPDIKQKFNEMLGKKSAGFISSIISAVNMSNNLRDCEPMSIISSAALAASLDLPINNNLSFAHLVPYKKKNGPSVCQFQLGWRGFLQLGIRTGQYKTIHVAVVYKDELKSWNPLTSEIEFTLQDEWKLRETARPADVAGYVAFFELLNGFKKYHYMTRKQCEAHGRRYSKSFASGQWTKDFDPMAMKTVIKQLMSKYGIMSIDMQKAIESDQAVIRDDGSLDYADYQNKTPHTTNTTIADVLEIPNEILEELNSLYDVLDVNQANRFMAIGQCKTIEEVQQLRDRLIKETSGKAPKKTDEPQDDELSIRKRNIFEAMKAAKLKKPEAVAYLQKVLGDESVKSMDTLTLEQAGTVLERIERRDHKCLSCAKDDDCILTKVQSEGCEVN